MHLSTRMKNSTSWCALICGKFWPRVDTRGPPGGTGRAGRRGAACPPAPWRRWAGCTAPAPGRPARGQIAAQAARSTRGYTQKYGFFQILWKTTGFNNNTSLALAVRYLGWVPMLWTVLWIHWFRVRIQWILSRIRIQGFDDQKLRNNIPGTAEIF